MTRNGKPPLIELDLSRHEQREVRSWLEERVAEMLCDEESLDEECPGLMAGLRKLLEAIE